VTQTLERFGSLSTADRQAFFESMSRTERASLEKQIDAGMGSPFGQYRYDPVGFVHNVLNEPTWSLQREMLESVLRYKITVVPAAHSVSKSHTAARVVAWWTSVHPPGTALTITTATNFQQVKTILWPHIRRMVSRHDLPGRTNTTEWIVDRPDGEGTELAAYGFSANDNDEAAVQGRHAPHMLIVVDEAGGISHELGKALYSLLTGGHTRMLLIGNPSTEAENTWFQRRAESGRKNTNVIPISVFSTPNFTGEKVDDCASCPAGTPPHSIATHLVDKAWLDEVVDEFGADSPYIEARAHARFPSNIQDKVLPITWLESAMATTEHSVTTGDIRLGVDVAADGGDEFVIAWIDGMKGSIVHSSVGAQNENSAVVADKILEWIHKAESEHAVRGNTTKVRVKIDAIGVGWGVVGDLIRRGDEGKHKSEIVAVNVAKNASEPDKYANQRAEMWWNLRRLIQPTMRQLTLVDDGGTSPFSITEYEGPVVLDIDTRVKAQLTGPMFRTDGSNRIVIEKKAEMKRRGLRSPDRGEALLLGYFEPPEETTTLKPFGAVGLGKPISWRDA
jgi:hypothetical protein